jgi:chromosome segregation ATPase
MTTLRTHAVVPVFEQRENRARSALARATAELTAKRATITALQQMIHSVDARVRSLHDGLDGSTTHTAETLQDVQSNIDALTDARHRLVITLRQTHHTAQSLAAQRQTAMRAWHASRQRLDLARSFARRADVMVALRAEEMQEAEWSFATSSGLLR